MPKRPTLQDVADAVGLAPATVSYALRGERGSADTLARVQAAATALGYQINPIAAALASGRSRTVAVLCGSTRDLWQQSLTADLARALLAEGRHALVADADGHPEREEALLAKLRDQRPDGLLVAPLDPFAAQWEELARQLPVVAIGDRLAEAPSAGAVVFDNARGFAQVFDHLAELGHRRIAVVLPERPSTPDRPAERLVAREARRCGMSVDLVRTAPATADADTMTDHLATALGGRDRPTAAFCLTDSFAFAVLRAARRLGLEVPGDLSVVGFEDVEFADLAGPGLTTVDWGRGAVVDAAVGQLLAAVDDDEPLRTVTISPRLVVRGTTGPAPSRS
ncbi:LacI family DNA-binding transcriptional regulator [Nocardioides sp. 503]|uniref:LacI family DNA-binding transcriptional regulator n=1 Tax=Nocardioides sp. 503 TaxID=2508326 RepID=UPI0010703993|nr:LacI family DNA-binding transcriptional regulator [Nocardioides sp. 503]